MSEPARAVKIRLGDVVVAQKVITPAQLAQALELQKRTGRRLGRILVEGGMCSEEQIAEAVARQLGIPYVNLKYHNLNNEIVRRLPESQARRFRAIVLEERKGSYVVGMADPSTSSRTTSCSAPSSAASTPRRSSEEQLMHAIDRIYRRTEEISGLAKELEQRSRRGLRRLRRPGRCGRRRGRAGRASLLQTVFEDAVQANASDVHIEPQERSVQIRFRIDGVLQPQAEADTRIGPAIVLRLKLMAGLDISEKRHAAGRTLQCARARAAGGRAPVDDAGAIRRVGGDAPAEPQGGPAQPRRCRHAERDADALPPGAAALQRHGAGHRPHRQRQDDHALRRARRDQHGGRRS